MKAAIAIIIVIVAIRTYQSFSTSTTDDIQKLEVYLEKALQDLTNDIFTIDSHDDFKVYDEDDFYEDWTIKLYENGQLTWWHDPTLYVALQGEKLKTYDYQTSQSNKSITISFPLNTIHTNTIKRKYLESAGCKNLWKLTNDLTNNIKLANNEKVGMEVFGKLYSPILLRIISISFIILFILLFIYLFSIFDFSNLRSLLAYLFTITVFRLIALGVGLFAGLNPLNISSNTFFINQLNPGIADLFVNGVLLLFMASALAKYLDVKIDRIQHESGLVLSSIPILFIGLSTLLFISFMKLWTASTYDLFQIEKVFNTSVSGILNYLSILIISCSLFILHIYLYKLLFRNASLFSKRLLSISLAIVATLSASYIFDYNIGLIYLGLGLAAYLILLDLFLDSSSLNVTWLLSWIIVISAFLSLFIFKNVTEYKKELRKQFLVNHYSKLDTDKIKIIDGLNIDTSIFDSTQNSNEQFSGINEVNQIAEQLRQKAFATNSFQSIAVSCLDANGSSVFEELPWFTSRLNRRLNTGISIGDNTYFDPIDNVYTKSFEYRNKNNQLSFYLSLSFDEDKSSNYEFPFSSIMDSKEFSFGVYKDGNIIYNNYNRQQYVQNIPQIDYGENDFVEKLSGTYNMLYYKASGDFNLVSVEAISDLIKPISLFSYLFTLLGLLLAGLTILNKHTKYLPQNISLNMDGNSLRDKIQLSVVSLIIVSFIAIAIVTAYYFKQISNGYSDTILSDKINSIASDVVKKDSILKDPSFSSSLQNHIASLSLVHRADILFYNKKGELFANTTKLESNDRKVPFQILNDLQNNSNDIKIVNAKISRTENIKSAFSNIRSKNMNLGFIQVLFPNNINSSIELDDFLGTLLNVYVFLFILAGGLAIAVASSITNPLSKLGEKLRQFNLGRKNEPLKWDNKGEIGTLITEYNQLILKLEESANFIAKTERDSAWREMAKQVAHEIKNPLTSMKLSIQHLDRAFQQDSENAKDLIPRVSATLIEQITNLSQIASEFSNFGQLPQAQNEKLIINEIVSTIHDLFRKRDDMEVTLTVPIDDIYIFADKNHLIRILNNLVKNAIQAIPQERRGKIQLTLYKDTEYAFIKVADNGIGIPENMYEKVFSPNFTTKSSGTGLGLAISANMIEAFNGKIYFDTVVNEGTNFYVRIPLMRLEDNYKMETKVNLD